MNQQASLQAKAYDAIYQMIVRCELTKGTVTSEARLCSLLGMSRTPVRSALQRLEWEGFLQIVPKHGILILDQSAQKAGDLLDVIAAILLFAVTAARHTKLQLLTSYMAEQETIFQALLADHAGFSADTSQALCHYERSMLIGLIEFTHNKELNQLFILTASRLYWQANWRRWKAPFLKNSAACVEELLQAIPRTELAVHSVLQPYIQLLKSTWE